MAFPTSVNSQITDAVTQANTKVLGDAPAIAMGNLFVATSQALANAAHNAVNTQQQSNVTSQAATTMGVATLFSIDTAGGQNALSATALAGASPQALAAMVGAGSATGSATAAGADAAPDSAPSDALKMIEESIEFVNSLNIDSAEPWAHAVREVMAAVAASLLELHKVVRAENMDVLKQAALCAALAQVIKAPEQFEQYQKIIELIKSL